MVEEVGISSKGMTASSLISKRLPLHCTACGKILLAYMSEQDRKSFYSRNALKAYTKNTVTDVMQLERELEGIRREGVAYDREDYKPGLWAIAVPIYDAADRIIASASVIVPQENSGAEGTRYLTGVIRKCGRELSQAIRRVG
jgi:DNA-binding IclR family transcriptional regulator